VSIEDELLRLAREREARTDGALLEMLLEAPAQLGRELRAYLARQVDHGRVKRTDEKVPRLTTIQGGLNELVCPRAEFTSGARLEFSIQMEESQRGWLVRRFKFHLYLPRERRIKVFRIHLNGESWHDPQVVPRCHLHIGDSRAHIPFPVMDPRLILLVICEHVEPDFGI
jgi:hypothetical protein